jgi:nitrogen-specific signal transduction histidine kinase
VRVRDEKLTRAKKMESLGLMAGGVAHDLNNVLSGIVSYPEMLLMDLPEESRLRKPIETMQKSGNRAVAIIQDLLTVARGIALEKDPLNLNRVVDKYLESERHTGLLRNNPDIALKTETDNSLLNIKGSSVHIEKALFNLVSNAIDALDDKGTVTIKTENRYLDKSLRGYEEIKPGEYAVLSVADDGEGISSKDLERIFEPFYSKKVMGRSGTGLGLPVVWNMIHEHDGYVDVRSGDNGTIFELYFPITREKILKSEEPVSLEDYRGNGEKILVVDDDESQRDILCAMMKKLGYLPTAMPGGEEAVEYLKTRSADLVILDMVMDPGINGKETYEQIVKIRPGQKAIIVSGFAETDDVREAQNLGVGRFIKKPAQMEKLGLAVREELDK